MPRVCKRSSSSQHYCGDGWRNTAFLWDHFATRMDRPMRWHLFSIGGMSKCGSHLLRSWAYLEIEWMENVGQYRCLDHFEPKSWKKS